MDIETNLGFLMQNITTNFDFFESGILETLGDDHIYSNFFRVGKHLVFRKKK
jgi:hypothetical protein